MKHNLIISPVEFDSEKHIYSYAGDTLSGITSIIGKYLFPNKYAGVSKSKLDERASHGSLVHAQVQSLVNEKWTKSAMAEFLDIAEPEVHEYLALVKKNKIKMLVSEYLVSDNIWVASSIDLVDKDYNLYDIKTTYDLDTEYIKWQLSIYAFLFEMQNDGLKAGKLYGIHLKEGKSKLVEVERIDPEIIKKLLMAFAQGAETFDNPLNSLGDGADEKMLCLAEIKSQMAVLKAEEEEINDWIKESLTTNKTRQVEKTGYYKVTWSLPTTSKKFNEKKFLADKPKLWEKYAEEKTTEGRLTVTFPKQK